jgi:leucyl-tRNA synthetase
MQTIAQMLSPLCPHLAEEMWARLGHAKSVTYEPFPHADPALLLSDTIEIPVQINGKVRSRINVAPDADEETLLALALQDDRVQTALDGKTPFKTVVVPGRMVNLVVK